MRRIFFGFFTYFHGLKTWGAHASLLRASILPFILDFVCLGAGLYYTATHVSAVASYFVHAPHVWYQYLIYAGVYLLTAISLFFAVIFAVFIFANLIVFPFNDVLAERTLRLNGIAIEAPRGTRARVGKTLRNTGVMLEKTLILLGLGSLLAAATFLIPGFGFFAAATGILLMAIDRIDYAWDQYQLSFRERLAFIRRHFPEVIGFAIALGLTTAIPVVNILLMPGSVVAAATLVARIRNQAAR